jgi:hypothetical protein
MLNMLTTMMMTTIDKELVKDEFCCYQRMLTMLLLFDNDDDELVEDEFCCY